MPQVFKVGSFWVFFWSNEGDPLEPVHVHIVEGKPHEHATKVWITTAGRCLLCNNNSHIPMRVLRNVMDVVEARSEEVISCWKDYFGTISYYC